MDHSKIWTFTENCDRARSPGEVSALFFRAVEGLGFEHVACCSHVDPLNPPVGAVSMIHYPHSWLAHFSTNNYAARDPVFLAAQRQLLPFRWSERRMKRRLPKDQARILEEAADAGLREGITIPLHSPGALPASCSLVFGREGVDPLRLKDAHWYAVYAHEAARRVARALAVRARVRLSPRERQCLELVGQGKDDYSIGVLLGIQTTTAHHTVQRAMGKYGVATRIQAVIRAMNDGEIRLPDIAN